ncbi:MAG TPA: hypothetical protein VGI81_11005 [Tepidisphaeraceae bacterium]|jgi:hypothetical protein
MSDPAGVLERHVCATHAQQLELPVGTYLLGTTAYPSFAQLVAAVAATGAGGQARQEAAV